MRTTMAALMVMILGLTTVAIAQAPGRDEVVYVPKTEYPVLDELEAANEAKVEAAKAKTEEILAAYRGAQEVREEPKQELRFDLSDVVKPEGPDAFEDHVWHFPPTPQYLTGTCWAFSATSFAESEIKRLTDQEIKLSEMWTAYWEVVNKAKGFVDSRGESLVDQGSESAALFRVYREHGVVPRADYEGVIGDDPRFNHDLMFQQVNSFLGWCKEANFWDEDTIVAMVRRILDATMGRPPETITWDGVEMTPQAFLSDVCRLDPTAYVSLMSTLSKPMWSRAEYAVPDNWWHDASYVNVPLDVWYQVILDNITSGHSVIIGGDTSEPGMNGAEDVAVVPSFDIPQAYIDQNSREFRFANGTTTDDHGIHLVGHTRVGGHDWFLIKDSNRSSRKGTYKGYYFYRDDYVKLKMLTITVHKDTVKDILERVDSKKDE